MAESTKLTVPSDSELAKRLRAAGDYLDIDTGDTVYRLYVSRADLLPPTPEQVARSEEGIRKAAGGWKDLVDAEEFKAYIAQRRRTSSRPSVRL